MLRKLITLYRKHKHKRKMRRELRFLKDCANRKKRNYQS